MNHRELEEGADISPNLRAIDASEFAVLLLSPNFASCTWCLDELTQIIRSREPIGGSVLPVFYGADAIELLKVSFAKYVKKFGQDRHKVCQWRDALREVRCHSGWDISNYQSDTELIHYIVHYICCSITHRIGFIRHANCEIRSTISIENVEPTIDRTLASRRQRPYLILPRWKYDVFLSFKAGDTRKDFLPYLYGELLNKGIKIVMNEYDLEVETSISQNLQERINESRFVIIVVSPHYASSAWCLDDLAKIFQCMEDKGRILPLFYNVNRSRVQNLWREWRDDLVEVSSLIKWNSKDYVSEKQIVKDIVKYLCSEVRKETALWTGDFEGTKEVKGHVDQTAKRAPRWTYGVFLSFRGDDTRGNFLSHLYHELKITRGINTFKDDQQLVKGSTISRNLLMAIEESRFAVVVLSANYASSTWCLDELVHIFKCMEGKNTILPIFYHVNPSYVRNQKGSFAEAFTKHERSGQDKRKMQQWRNALIKLASLSGWHANNQKPERELIEDIGKFVGKVIQVEVDNTMSRGDFETFKSREQAMEQVIKALKNDEVNIIGVCGKGGIGKTTMVKHASALAQKIGLFDHVFLAFVSRNPDLRKIQGKLADMLGVKLQMETETERARLLKAEIMTVPKVLIILDNIQEYIDLSSIGIPSFNELQRCGSKVLITTRKKELCQPMGSQEEIVLAILSEEDSWNLFKKNSRMSFESTDFCRIAMMVAEECAGLPISLITVAKSLRDKVQLGEWEHTARQLKKFRTVFLHDQGDGFNCIKLSYYYLRGEYAKSFLLLCCLFPEDDDIRIADLMEYGYGIGLFRHSKTMQEARATTHLVVTYLKACNLLMEGAEDGCIRMHDVIREMALSILFENGHHFFATGKKEDGHKFLVEAGLQWPLLNYAGNSYSGISVMRSEIRQLPQELECSKLQILLLQGNAEIKNIPNTFLQHANAMRVLDLSDTGISSLPSSFSFMTNLHTLSLDGCKAINDVSALRGLGSLEILSMRELPLKELPMEIGHLSHLRILDVTSDFINTVPAKVVSRLHRLEELYMQCEFRDWSSTYEGARNAGFYEVTSLSHLNILKLNISDAGCLPEMVESSPSWIIFDIRISREPLFRDYSSNPYLSQDHSRALTLSTTVNTLPHWFIMSVTEKAESLQYIDCNDLNNMLVEYEGGILHGLKYLAVVGRHEKLEQLMNTVTWGTVSNEPIFKSLEELHLVGLCCLKELCIGELPPRSLFNLKSLKVEACSNLVNALLPSLYLHNLTILVVSCCSKLKSLFTSDVAQCLLNLEDLSVSECPSLESVIEASEETVNKKIAFPKLKKLLLCDLPVLTKFYCMGNAVIDCPSLEQLSVQYCPEFLTSTSDFHTWKGIEVSDLRHLRKTN